MEINKQDFIGFTFNGRHSSGFNILSVTGGSRYQDTLVPSFTDYTEKVSGATGQNYYGSDLDTREFSLNIAYDKVSETTLRELRNWLKPGTVGDLVFDERPYKTYTARIGQPPSLSYLCFSDNGERVYKGEGTVNFICDYPLARTSGRNKELKNYTSDIIEEWKDSSRLLYNLSKTSTNGYDHLTNLAENSGEASDYGFKVYNPGDMETGFILEIAKTGDKLAPITFYLKNTDKFFTLSLRKEDTDSESAKYGPASALEKEIAGQIGTITINTSKHSIFFSGSSSLEFGEGDIFSVGQELYPKNGEYSYRGKTYPYVDYRFNISWVGDEDAMFLISNRQTQETALTLRSYNSAIKENFQKITTLYNLPIYFALKEGDFYNVPQHTKADDYDIILVMTSSEASDFSEITIDYDYLYF